MIIFDLDGTLADCEQRRHFVDPEKNPDYEYTNYYRNHTSGRIQEHVHMKWVKDTGYDEFFTPDWKSFYEACDQDKPITATLDLIETLVTHDEYEQLPLTDVEIWSGRCSSV